MNTPLKTADGTTFLLPNSFSHVVAFAAASLFRRLIELISELVVGGFEFTQNSLKIDVELEGKKAGSLHIARGSVEWWPDYKKVNAHRFNWWQFVDLLGSGPKRRSKR